jgi:hypothetical protein
MIVSTEQFMRQMLLSILWFSNQAALAYPAFSKITHGIETTAPFA